MMRKTGGGAKVVSTHRRHTHKSLLLLLFSLLCTMVATVDKSKFKTCEQSPFCAEHRFSTEEPPVVRIIM